MRIPFADLLQPHMGADAIWWSFPASSIVALVLSMAYYRWGLWRQARMLTQDSRAVAMPAEVPAHPPSPVANPIPEPEPEPATVVPTMK